MLVRTVCVTVWLCLAARPCLGSAAAGASPGVRAVTRPSADITLSFVQPGRIAQVQGKEGDRVQVGQVLIRQDDTAEQVQLAQLKAQAEDITQIRASEASLAQKRVDLQKVEKAAASKAATALEVEHARLDVTIAELSLELAKFEHQQAGERYREQKIRIGHMQLESPVDGRIEDVKVEVGESLNALTEAIRIVRTAPLWVDAPVPLSQAVGLETGKAVQVQFGPVDNPVRVESGRILFVAAVADAASGTLKVRVEVPNESGRLAGEHVLVMFQNQPSK